MTTARRRHLLGSLACLCVIGCAGPSASLPARQGPGSAHDPAGQSIRPEAAIALIVPGQSTKADVAGALGEAIVIPFDSDYAVWVYRWSSPATTPRAAPELVVLFEPGGIATKARLRSGAAEHSEQAPL